MHKSKLFDFLPVHIENALIIANVHNLIFYLGVKKYERKEEGIQCSEWRNKRIFIWFLKVREVSYKINVPWIKISIDRMRNAIDVDNVTAIPLTILLDELLWLVARFNMFKLSFSIFYIHTCKFLSVYHTFLSHYLSLF